MSRQAATHHALACFGSRKNRIGVTPGCCHPPKCIIYMSTDHSVQVCGWSHEKLRTLRTSSIPLLPKSNIILNNCLLRAPQKTKTLVILKEVIAMNSLIIRPKWLLIIQLHNKTSIVLYSKIKRIIKVGVVTC